MRAAGKSSSCRTPRQGDSKEARPIPQLFAVEARVDRGRLSPDDTANSPHRISCDDGNDYAVKPKGADRQFANELLAFAIGSLVDVPVFDAALVTISDSLRAASPPLAARFNAGIHFGCRIPKDQHFNFKNVSPALVASSIRNKDKFYRLAMFDELIANTDRGSNLGNLVAVETNEVEPRHEFYAIDHGHAFTGASWAAEALLAHVPAPLFPVLDVVKDVLTSKADLLGSADTIQGLAHRFQETIASARSSLNSQDREAVLYLLTSRSGRLADWVAGPYALRLPNLQ